MACSTGINATTRSRWFLFVWLWRPAHDSALNTPTDHALLSSGNHQNSNTLPRSRRNWSTHLYVAFNCNWEKSHMCHHRFSVFRWPEFEHIATSRRNWSTQLYIVFTTAIEKNCTYMITGSEYSAETPPNENPRLSTINFDCSGNSANRTSSRILWQQDQNTWSNARKICIVCSSCPLHLSQCVQQEFVDLSVLYRGANALQNWIQWRE